MRKKKVNKDDLRILINKARLARGTEFPARYGQVFREGSPGRCLALGQFK